MVKHNNALAHIHLRKDWKSNVKTWFNQPARKQARRLARQNKAERITPRPIENLRPIVKGETIRYNTKQRYGKGFTLQELKTAGLTPLFARSIGIAVDHRR